MIYFAVTHIAKSLNQHLKKHYNLDEDIVVVSDLTDIDGSTPTNMNNKVVISLVNIEKDYSFKNQPLFNPGFFSGISHTSLSLNLNIVVVACFSSSNYMESLKYLSATTHYFQSTPVFDHHNSPDLNAGIEKLILDIENLKLHELSSLWGILGGKYLPSIFYKVRAITVDSKFVVERKHELFEPESSIGDA